MTQQEELNDELLKAVCECDDEEVKNLLEQGADVNVRDNYGNTPLYSAIDFEVAKVLIFAGADVNVRDNYGNSPLHNVCNNYDVWDNTEIAEALIAAGADVNSRNSEGITPLDMALEICFSEGLAEALIAAGAEIPKDWREKLGKKDCTRLPPEYQQELTEYIEQLQAAE